MIITAVLQLICAAVLVAGASVTTITTTISNPFQVGPVGTYYTIHPESDTSLCIGVSTEPTYPQVFLQTCELTYGVYHPATDLWQIEYGPTTIENYYFNSLSPGQKPTNYSAVEVLPASGDNPIWNYNKSNHHIEVIGTDLCLDLKDGKGVPGNPIQLYKCYSGNTNQVWIRKTEFTQYSPGTTDPIPRTSFIWTTTGYTTTKHTSTPTVIPTSRKTSSLTQHTATPWLTTGYTTTKHKSTPTVIPTSKKTSSLNQHTTTHIWTTTGYTTTKHTSTHTSTPNFKTSSSSKM